MTAEDRKRELELLEKHMKKTKEALEKTLSEKGSECYVELGAAEANTDIALIILEGLLGYEA